MSQKSKNCDTLLKHVVDSDIYKYMDFKNWLLNEMAINRFELLGDWGPKDAKRGWDQPSVGILTSPKGVEKIRNMWSRSPVDFDMFFVRQKGAKEHMEVGEVSPEWIKEKLNYDIQLSDAVTIFFTQNQGADRVPMTAWTIGHRFGHALEAGGRGRGQAMGGDWSDAGALYTQFDKQVHSDVSRLAKMVYGESSPSYEKLYRSRGVLHKLAQALGTMKSARDGNLSHFGEFAHEIFGQYVLSGRIKFNDIPRTMGTRYSWGNPSPVYYSRIHQDEPALDDANETLRRMEVHYASHLREVLEYARGKIYVM